ncbi:UTP--glucose-1-phosphate uridylyltransferase [Luteimicrobium xylanilyticum]|uniref:UTP--glucose-1-phosphate uridylyltransferase n=1 Tax=Luteimicrobium xylanilyticum TaxID=1133546 RepID=A0A5P9QA16_9MICO|nr:UTP--glucose-1-phosphate uridylyltransferase [Luteimicrobium xylanilyticum]QFU98274.1 UTP--glucose-1-phosphate uridylyltransferase [Luteimicrobium xylanilyticum]
MDGPSGLDLARDKMRDAGVPDVAIKVFEHGYHLLEEGATGILPESDVEPLTDVADAHDFDAEPDDAAREALGRTALIKLNGGLGTSMGMDRAKSLLPVRGELTFLDVIARQVLAAREEHGVRLPLVLMNSFRTRDDSLAALERYPDLAVDGVPQDFLQNREPKLLADDLTPVEWPQDPSLEWCPPGHGDLYTALQSSGVLDALRQAGFRYAAVSNADNLGSAPSAAMAGWFASTGAGFGAEVARRTPADRKGGHLVVRASDHRIVLRETSQVADDDKDAASDIERHAFFNTNNLWLDLDRLAALLEEKGGVLPLPLIRNEKTVDPSDGSSPRVIQIETAMGAAIELFDDAAVIEVGRERFLPVKTTDDLLRLRSDVYALGDDGTLRATVPEPEITLDPEHYRTVGAFDAHFPHGVPSLVLAESLTVEGDWTFGDRVSVVGPARLTAPDDGAPATVPDDATVGGDGVVEPEAKRDVPVDLSDLDGGVTDA